jgi:hypothetical protein
MISHKVKVFWPVDERWYEGTVEEYNQAMGEHKLRYIDGDTEWVKIGDIAGAIRNTSPGGKRGESAESKKEVSPPKNAGGAGGQSPNSSGHMQSSGAVDGQQQRMMYNQGNYAGDRPPYQQYGPPPYGGPMNPGPPGGYQGMPYPTQVGPYPPHMPPHYYPLPPNMNHSAGPSPTSQGSPDKKNLSKGGSPNKKNPPKTWSKEEDAHLLNLVQRMQIPVKWSFVAQNMEGRSGKQCRERYVNHLNPRLKSCDWSPIEDATIFHLYNTTGSQWAKMSKMIPGRTDNGIKNRFHNLRRQLEREDEQRMRLSKTEDFHKEVNLEKIRSFPNHLRGKADECWDVFESLGVLAAQSVLGGSLARNASRFGPFRKAVDTGEQCSRCGLFAPSTHCGIEICTKSNWCIACTRVPPHLCGNLLRECINLRRVAGGDDKEEQKTDTESMLKRGALSIAQD